MEVKTMDMCPFTHNEEICSNCGDPYCDKTTIKCNKLLNGFCDSCMNCFIVDE